MRRAFGIFVPGVISLALFVFAMFMVARVVTVLMFLAGPDYDVIRIFRP